MVVNRRLADLGLERQPAKTFIGRIARGFDFLGYHFTPDGLAIAEATAARFVARATAAHAAVGARGLRATLARLGTGRHRPRTARSIAGARHALNHDIGVGSATWVALKGVARPVMTS